MKEKELGKLFIISSCSGAGKTTLVNEILSRIPSQCGLGRLVTYTSRSAREGERDAEDFYFISPSEFEKKIKSGFFIEWSCAYGHYYGSPASVIDDLKGGFSRILVIDRLGASQIVNKIEDVVTIWISVSSLEVLRCRLISRGKNSMKEIKKRLAIAQGEVEQEIKKTFYKYKVLNDIFEDAAQELEAIFLQELK